MLAFKIWWIRVWPNSVNGVGREMHPREQIMQIINTSQRILIQYVQVRALVNYLMKYDNIFRPLTALELLLASVESKRELLSILHGILLPDSSADDNDKAR